MAEIWHKYASRKSSMNENNLARTIELIDLCFKLKEAYLRRQHPEASPEKIRDLINRGILARKERQWARPEGLIKMKELSNRPQDLLDIAALKEALNDQSDPTHAKR